jgi:hypothetical protein
MSSKLILFELFELLELVGLLVLLLVLDEELKFTCSSSSPSGGQIKSIKEN